MARRRRILRGWKTAPRRAGLDKRTGCFQSNVNFLHQLVNKNALDARQRLNAANNEIAALRAALASLQTTVEQLQAAQKAANDKKPPAQIAGGDGSHAFDRRPCTPLAGV